MSFSNPLGVGGYGLTQLNVGGAVRDFTSYLANDGIDVTIKDGDIGAKGNFNIGGVNFDFEINQDDFKKEDATTTTNTPPPQNNINPWIIAGGAVVGFLLLSRL